MANEAATYKHAFLSTTADRDRLAAIRSELSNPLDAGHFRFDFSRFGIDSVAPDDLQLVESLADKFEHGAHDETIRFLLSSTNVRIAHVHDAGYFESFAAYYLACLFVAQNRLDRAMTYTDKIVFDAPSDGADFLPYDLRQASRLSKYQQEIAIENGKPGFVIVSLLKSASSFLSTAVATAFQIPTLKIALGEGAYALVVRRWADQVARGGAVTHEHFQAAKENIETLRQSKIDNIWLQIRDPRDAAFSAMRMAELADRNGVNPNMPPGDESAQFAFICRRFGDWLDGWLGAAECNFSDLKIGIINYSEVTEDVPAVVSRLSGNRMTDDAKNRIHEFFDQTKRGAIPRTNFRSGIGGEWRSRYGAKVSDEVWVNIPEKVKSFLRLDP